MSERVNTRANPKVLNTKRIRKSQDVLPTVKNEIFKIFFFNQALNQPIFGKD